MRRGPGREAVQSISRCVFRRSFKRRTDCVANDSDSADLTQTLNDGLGSVFVQFNPRSRRNNTSFRAVLREALCGIGKGQNEIVQAYDADEIVH